MSLNIQHSIIGGRLTKKPELKQTESGLLVCPFTVAVNLGSGEDKYTEYNECVAYGKIAETIARCFDKGSEICVICSKGWRTREWKDHDGSKRYKTEHRVSDFSFVGTRNLPAAQLPTPNEESAAAAKYAPRIPDAPPCSTPQFAPHFDEMPAGDDTLPF